MKPLFAILFVVLFSFPASSKEKVNGDAAWQPPPGGLIQDKWAAIEIAHAAWFSVWSPHKKPESVDVWEKDFDAWLIDGVWEVTEPLKPNEIPFGPVVFVSQKDGRILNMYMNQ